MLTLALLFLVPLAALALCGTALTVLVQVVRIALPGGRPRGAWRLPAWPLAVVAASVYVLGIGLVQFDDHEAHSGAGSSPAPACREGDPARTAGLRDSRPSYLPLGFACLRADGSEYEGEPVLRWFNGVALGGAAGVVFLGWRALLASRRRTAEARTAGAVGGTAARERPPGTATRR
ncbi:hypothetical protein [Streptomyces sp. SPB074]|uniref:hypothetical protein n=1 Tax=Streptomyces sp. (strain SPB074) TaxID=465543 RepID=UPI0001D1E1A9|nr:hypothetical protein [Streptomyces sp. SPB074]EDY44350.2 conserved hypothetical protein [Streptomyces sp. SPB074]